jgi:hypothetical protein
MRCSGARRAMTPTDLRIAIMSGKKEMDSVEEARRENN